MNEAFKLEILEMEADQKAAEELEECYFSDDEDLVPNTHKREDEEEDWDNIDPDEEDQCESIEVMYNASSRAKIYSFKYLRK